MQHIWWPMSTFWLAQRGKKKPQSLCEMLPLQAPTAYRAGRWPQAHQEAMQLPAGAAPTGTARQICGAGRFLGKQGETSSIPVAKLDPLEKKNLMAFPLQGGAGSERWKESELRAVLAEKTG